MTVDIGVLYKMLEDMPQEEKQPLRNLVMHIHDLFNGIASDADREACEACEGTGVRAVDCLACDCSGEGKTPLSGSCHFCKGKGEYAADCDICGGSGYVEVDNVG